MAAAHGIATAHGFATMHGIAAAHAQANTTSKLQTELGVYHLNFDETLPPPKDDYPWPSRDALLEHFDEKAREYGIMPYIRFNTNVAEMSISGAKERASSRVAAVGRLASRGEHQSSGAKLEASQGSDGGGTVGNRRLLDACGGVQHSARAARRGRAALAR